MAERSQKIEASTTESNKDVCVVCCEEIRYFSIGSCDHPICYKCSARMRVLASQKYCPSCRCELDQVVFSHQGNLFSEFTLNKLLGNRKHGIRFEDGTIRQEFESLLDYVCSICGNGPMGSMRDLKSHVWKEHEKQFCLICMQNLAAFPRELKLYSKRELVRHRKEGDNDEKSHRGHPECRFCDERYFDNDALLLHLRKSHFWCHFCEHDGKQDYYDVYENLRQHFASDHYLCDEGGCAQEKFTSVFRDKIDYQAHKLAIHRKKLNKFQAKEARKVDIDYKFEPRSGASSSITGADYEDVRQNTRQDARRGQGNTKSATSHRYHREANGTLNFYDYENVEKDRKKFLGKNRRHEAEEVDGPERSKVNRRIAATRSLSQSEPDIPSNFDEITTNRPVDDVDGVIGFSERISDDIVKTDIKETTNQSVSVKPKPVKPPEPKNVPAEAEDENFPSLPGAKAYAPSNIFKKAEAFPALPLSTASAAKPVHTNWSGSNASNTSGKKKITHINGVVVKIAKSKKKGKTKQIKQPDNTDFPALGTSQPPTSKPPSSNFNKFDSPVPNGTANASKKSESAKPPPSKFNNFDNVSSSSAKKLDSGKQTASKVNKFEDVPLSNAKAQPVPMKCDSAKPPPSKFNKFERPPTPKEKRNPKDNKNQSDSKPVEDTWAKDQHSKRPPPGLQAALAEGTAAPNLKSGPPGLSKGIVQNTPAGPPPGFKPQSMDSGMMERNMRLLGMLTQFLDEFNMNIFKDLSGKFRRGLTNGQEYYAGISEVLGDNLKYVFSELVALLPDEDKRNELLRVHNDVKVKSKRIKEEKRVARDSAPVVNADYSKPAVWGAQSKQEFVEEVRESRCEKCGVIVRNDEIQEHLKSHGESFPALPITTKKKNNYSFNSSARINKHVSVKSAWGK